MVCVNLYKFQLSIQRVRLLLTSKFNLYILRNKRPCQRHNTCGVLFPTSFLLPYCVNSVMYRNQNDGLCFLFLILSNSIKTVKKSFCFQRNSFMSKIKKKCIIMKKKQLQQIWYTVWRSDKAYMDK